MREPNIVLVTRPTRLQQLRERWVTTGQVRFALKAARAHEALRRETAGEPAGLAPAAPAKAATLRRDRAAPATAEVEFSAYEAEERQFLAAKQRVLDELDFGLPIRELDRSLVPNFDFYSTAVVVVLGQDGLVANTAKYVGDVPLIGVNPDPQRFDGVLLPFQIADVRQAVQQVLKGGARTRHVTLAEVRLNDGQRLLAFNDFFIGARSHISARYTLEVGGQCEPQSSSGVLVSTGAGSTGWFSSLLNMTRGLSAWLGQEIDAQRQLPWDARQLLWAVREPFVSKQSQAGLTAGALEEGQELVIESLMPEAGVVFSDGIEADYLTFNSGTIARVGVCAQRAQLVVR